MGKKSTKILFFIGWALSPLSWWNDAFVNIPLSYLMARVVFYITGFYSVWLVIASYWLTNILGIAMLYFTAGGLISIFKNRPKDILLFLAAIVIYSVFMFFLDKAGLFR